MISAKDDLLKSLIETFLMEKGTMEFYSQASDRAVNSDAKRTFKELSGWEEQHMDYILFLYQAINGDKDIITYKEFRNKAEAPVTEAGIPIKDLETKMEKYSVTNELGALTLAMEIEGKSYNLYRGFLQSAADTNARVVFREMMEQELGHVKQLKDLRVKLADVYK